MVGIGPSVLGGILPARCLHCGRRASGSEWAPFLCPLCAAQMVPDAAGRVPVAVEAAAAGVVTAFAYRGPAASLVRALKFHGATSLGGPLGSALGERLRDLPAGELLVVPLPLHWRRRWRRGYNQAAVVARAVARARPGFRYAPVLRRARATRPQVGLHAASRRRNVHDVFALAPRSARRVRGRRVVLVDDVVTTGATLHSARECVRAAGAAAVFLAAAAAAPRPAADV